MASEASQTLLDVADCYPFPSKPTTPLSPPARGLRVLFMHGLESSHQGRKVQLLRRCFEQVEAVDMSAFCNVRRNAVRNPFLLAIPLCAGMPAVPLLAFLRHQSAGLAEIAAVAAVAVLAILACFRWAVRYAMRRCVGLQREAVERHRPDVVVASSFGGAVAAWLILQGGWAGPTLLLAPAQGRLATLMSWPFSSARLRSDLARAMGMVPLVVVHGTQDTTVPLQDSRELVAGAAAAATANGRPVTVRLATPKDNHSLRRLTRSDAAMAQWVWETAQQGTAQPNIATTAPSTGPAPARCNPKRENSPPE